MIISNDASNNTIGGTVAGAGNTIAFNVLAGVSVESGTGDSILSNSIYSNGQLGIDLVHAEPRTPGRGPNNLQTAPVLTTRRRRRTDQRDSGNADQPSQHSVPDPVLHQPDSRSVRLRPGTDADRLDDGHNRWPGKCHHLLHSVDQSAGEYLGDGHGHQHR